MKTLATLSFVLILTVLQSCNEYSKDKVQTKGINEIHIDSDIDLKSNIELVGRTFKYGRINSFPLSDEDPFCDGEYLWTPRNPKYLFFVDSNTCYLRYAVLDNYPEPAFYTIQKYAYTRDGERLYFQFLKELRLVEEKSGYKKTINKTPHTAYTVLNDLRVESCGVNVVLRKRKKGFGKIFLDQKYPISRFFCDERAKLIDLNSTVKTFTESDFIGKVFHYGGASPPNGCRPDFACDCCIDEYAFFKNNICYSISGVCVGDGTTARRLSYSVQDNQLILDYQNTIEVNSEIINEDYEEGNYSISFPAIEDRLVEFCVANCSENIQIWEKIYNSSNSYTNTAVGINVDLTLDEFQQKNAQFFKLFAKVKF